MAYYNVLRVMDVDFTGVPVGGACLTRGDLVEIFVALRALVNGTDPDEANRAHAVTVAYVVAEAIEREGGVT